jgi:hypothetical protein
LSADPATARMRPRTAPKRTQRCHSSTIIPGLPQSATARQSFAADRAKWLIPVAIFAERSTVRSAVRNSASIVADTADERCYVHADPGFENVDILATF